MLVTDSAALRNSKSLTPEALQLLTSDACVVFSRECRTSSNQKFHAIMAFGSRASSAHCSDLWLPLDVALEDAMDGYDVNPTSAIEIITGNGPTFSLLPEHSFSCI